MTFNKLAIHWVLKKAPKDETIEEYFNWLIDRGWGNGYVYIHLDLWDDEFDYIIEHLTAVHRGFTYAEIENNYMCFGFDTAHHGDTEWNWSEEAVREETIDVYDQIHNYYKIKYTDNNAEILLALKSDNDLVRQISEHRIFNNHQFKLDNIKDYLV
jgi:hypothetical protein